MCREKMTRSATFIVLHWFHLFNNQLIFIGIIILVLTIIQWWRDIVREGTYQGLHTKFVTKGLRWGIILFIISEIFFISFFWAFFHRILSPTIDIGSLWLVVQEKTTTLGGTEPHHYSWKCKVSHRFCCHGHLAPPTMEDPGTSTLLTQYESMRLRSLRRSETTTERDPVQHKRWTYLRYRAINEEHHQRWTRWWCATPSKHLAKSDKGGDCIEGT